MENNNVLQTLADLQIHYTEQQLELLSRQQITDSTLETVNIAVSEIGLDKDAVAALLLKDADSKATEEQFGQNVLKMTIGLKRVDGLYHKQTSYETENSRK